MSYLRCLKVLSVALLLSLFVPLGAMAASDDVVAQVGSIVVTKYELGREFQRILPTSGNYHGGVDKEKMLEIRDKALEESIDQALKTMYALDNEIVADVAGVKAGYEKVRSRFSSEEEFVKALGGETPEAYRSSIFRKQLALAAEKVAVDSKVTVSDDDIRKYYDENTDLFMRPAQYQASHILIKVDPASTKEQREERHAFAKELHAKAIAGEDFYNLAYYNSDDRSKYVGGDLGFFSADQVEKEFAEALIKLKVGEISPVVESLYGYHIIKLTDMKPAGRMSFSEVQTTLVPEMKKAHRDKLYGDWIKELRAKYTIQKFIQDN